MKEWALKHPIMTFLLADSFIGILSTIVKAIAGGKKKETSENEVNEHGSSGDIQ